MKNLPFVDKVILLKPTFSPIFKRTFADYFQNLSNSMIEVENNTPVIY